jgi:hypothetical protein
MDENKYLQVKKCKICGKTIVRPNWQLYTYKLRIGNNPYSYFCSYTCYRKAGGDSGKECNYVKSKPRRRK